MGLINHDKPTYNWGGATLYDLAYTVVPPHFQSVFYEGRSFIDCSWEDSRSSRSSLQYPTAWVQSAPQSLMSVFTTSSMEDNWCVLEPSLTALPKFIPATCSKIALSIDPFFCRIGETNLLRGETQQALDIHNVEVIQVWTSTIPLWECAGMWLLYVTSLCDYFTWLVYVTSLCD